MDRHSMCHPKFIRLDWYWMQRWSRLQHISRFNIDNISRYDH